MEIGMLVGVGVNVNVGVEVNVSVGVDVGVNVEVGVNVIVDVGVIVGPKTCPGLQALTEIARIKMIAERFMFFLLWLFSPACSFIYHQKLGLRLYLLFQIV
jgi:hypothetical protein